MENTVRSDQQPKSNSKNKRKGLQEGSEYSNDSDSSTDQKTRGRAGGSRVKDVEISRWE